MPLQTGFLNELVALVADARIGFAASEALDSIMTRVSQHIDSPLRLFASSPADAKLNFGLAEVTLGDGAGRAVPPISDLIPTTVAGTLNFQTAAVTGLTFTLDGAAFSAFPTSTIGRFRRVVFLLQGDGSVNMHFSAEQTTLAATDNPGALLSGLDGLAIGWVDLVATGATAFKTAGSATSVIETNPTGSAPTIHRFGSGGGGSGASLPLRLQSVSTPNITVSGDYFRLSDNREITTWDGLGTDSANYGKNLTLSATTILGGAPANATQYHLYVDMTLLAAEVTIATGKYANRKVYPVSSASNPFVLSTTLIPETVNRGRYIWRGSVTTATTGNAWSGTGSSFLTAGNLQAVNGPLSISPRVASLSKQLVGTVGAVGQVKAGHVIASSSFPSTMGATLASWYALTSVNDGSGNARNLTNSGTPVTFASTGILGVASSAASFNGTTQGLSSSAAFFNPGDADFAVGIWAKPTTWAPGGTQCLLAQFTTAGNQRSWEIDLVSGQIQFALSTDGISSAAQIQIPHSFVDGEWHHIAMRYVASTNTAYFYLDGVQAGSTTLTAGLFTSGTPDFRVGVRSGGAVQFYAGLLDELFFINGYAMSDAEMRKLFSSRLDHNANVLASNQNWTGTFYSATSGCATQDNQSWLVCKNNANSLFFDFSDLAAADSAELYLFDTGLSAVSVSAKPPYDQIFNANPTFPIAVAFGEVPVLEVGKEITSGVWEWVSPEGLMQVSSTQITGSVQTLFDAGALRVRIRARVGNDPTGISQSSPSSPGLVQSYAPNPKVATLTLSSASYTVLDGDGYDTMLVTTGASDRTLTLPSAATNAGRVLFAKKVDAGAGKVILDGAGAETIDGATTLELNTQFAFARVMCDGTGWLITG